LKALIINTLSTSVQVQGAVLEVKLVMREGLSKEDLHYQVSIEDAFV
jgi:hypothetical protein